MLTNPSPELHERVRAAVLGYSDGALIATKQHGGFECHQCATDN
jgi:hypothetical protein